MSNYATGRRIIHNGGCEGRHMVPCGKKNCLESLVVSWASRVPRYVYQRFVRARRRDEDFRIIIQNFSSMRSPDSWSEKLSASTRDSFTAQPFIR